MPSLYWDQVRLLLSTHFEVLSSVPFKIGKSGLAIGAGVAGVGDAIVMAGKMMMF